jgi:acyl-coenzyme A thioesterase PaaI-like protein
MNILPENIKENPFLKAFGIFKIPMIGFLSPRILELNNQRTEIVIPLSRRSKNHLNSMYFGALSVGADCAGGMIAMKLIRESGHKISLVFKDFHADFLKRPESDVHFICEQGKEIQALVQKTIQTKERENLAVHIDAVCPKTSKEPVAKFILTLSLKAK